MGVRVTAGRAGEIVISSAFVCALGVQLCVVVGVVGFANLDVVLPKGPALVGEVVGVVCRRGDGDAGDSGRRKGELRVGEVP